MVVMTLEYCNAYDINYCHLIIVKYGTKTFEVKGPVTLQPTSHQTQA